MTTRQACIFWLMLLPVAVLPALPNRKAHPAPSDVQSSSAMPSKPPEDRGAKIFAENCSRCHNPPMSISPRITGTVLVHMRVRARLSRDDESALLKYMAP